MIRRVGSHYGLISGYSTAVPTLDSGIRKETHTDPRLDDLLEVAKRVVDSNFDQGEFLRWREKVLEFLSDEFGVEHYYSRYFEEKASEK